MKSRGNGKDLGNSVNRLQGMKLVHVSKMLWGELSAEGKVVKRKEETNTGEEKGEVKKGVIC